MKAPTKAMVLAAGLGTRLRPLTNDRPKALVELSGRTLLQITLTRLRKCGIRDIIINVHHFADMVVNYLDAHSNFGMNIVVSREDDLLLDTGGGLKKARWFFEDSGEPFIVHNVDIISTIDLARMVHFHQANDALATLAVQDRKTSRYLLFDSALQLCGRLVAEEQPEMVRQSASIQPLAFCGVHVISPGLLSMIEDDGAFSIIPTYLKLAGRSEKILAFRADEYHWHDLGTQASLQQATQDMERLAL